MLPILTSLALLPTLCSASGLAQVYIYPATVPNVHSVDPRDANALLAHHLGLEAFESLSRTSYGESVLGRPTSFVGRQTEVLCLLSIDTRRPEDVLPDSLTSVLQLPTVSGTASQILGRYTELARTTYDSVILPSSSPSSYPSLKFLDVFSIAAASSAKSDALERFMGSLSALVAFVEDAQVHGERFGAFDVKGLPEIEQEWGRDSEVYTMSATTLKATIQSAMAKHLPLAVLTPSSTHLRARQIVQPPQQSPFPVPDTAPIFSTSTCFTTASACANATASCSSRGACAGVTRAGRTCFVCQCGKAPATEGGRNITWAGNMCQKKDISQEFTLIVGTVIFLILVSVGSIALLYAIGDQELPGTLMGGVGGHVKQE